jgi:hypothetical protein
MNWDNPPGFEIKPAEEGTWTERGYPDFVQVAGRNFVRSSGLPRAGVAAHYREDVPHGSRHLYVRAGKWEITHVDAANPDHGHLLEHFLRDVLFGEDVFDGIDEERAGAERSGDLDKL